MSSPEHKSPAEENDPNGVAPMDVDGENQSVSPNQLATPSQIQLNREKKFAELCFNRTKTVFEQGKLDPHTESLELAHQAAEHIWGPDEEHFKAAFTEEQIRVLEHLAFQRSMSFVEVVYVGILFCITFAEETQVEAKNEWETLTIIVANIANTGRGKSAMTTLLSDLINAKMYLDGSYKRRIGSDFFAKYSAFFDRSNAKMLRLPQNAKYFREKSESMQFQRAGRGMKRAQRKRLEMKGVLLTGDKPAPQKKKTAAAEANNNAAAQANNNIVLQEIQQPDAEDDDDNMIMDPNMMAGPVMMHQLGLNPGFGYQAAQLQNVAAMMGVQGMQAQPHIVQAAISLTQDIPADDDFDDEDELADDNENADATHTTPGGNKGKGKGKKSKHNKQRAVQIRRLGSFTEPGFKRALSDLNSCASMAVLQDEGKFFVLLCFPKIEEKSEYNTLLSQFWTSGEAEVFTGNDYFSHVCSGKTVGFLLNVHPKYFLNVIRSPQRDSAGVLHRTFIKPFALNEPQAERKQDENAWGDDKKTAARVLVEGVIRAHKIIADKHGLDLKCVTKTVVADMLEIGQQEEQSKNNSTAFKEAAAKFTRNTAKLAAGIHLLQAALDLATDKSESIDDFISWENWQCATKQVHKAAVVQEVLRRPTAALPIVGQFAENDANPGAAANSPLKIGITKPEGWGEASIKLFSKILNADNEAAKQNAAKNATIKYDDYKPSVQSWKDRLAHVNDPKAKADAKDKGMPTKKAGAFAALVKRASEDPLLRDFCEGTTEGTRKTMQLILRWPEGGVFPYACFSGNGMRPSLYDDADVTTEIEVEDPITKEKKPVQRKNLVPRKHEPDAKQPDKDNKTDPKQKKQDNGNVDQDVKDEVQEQLVFEAEPAVKVDSPGGDLDGNPDLLDAIGAQAGAAAKQHEGQAKRRKKNDGKKAAADEQADDENAANAEQQDIAKEDDQEKEDQPKKD